MVSGQLTTYPPGREFIVCLQKKYKLFIDKIFNLWYNNNVKGEAERKVLQRWISNRATQSSVKKWIRIDERHSFPLLKTFLKKVANFFNNPLTN